MIVTIISALNLLFSVPKRSKHHTSHPCSTHSMSVPPFLTLRCATSAHNRRFRHYFSMCNDHIYHFRYMHQGKIKYLFGEALCFCKPFFCLFSPALNTISNHHYTLPHCSNLSLPYFLINLLTFPSDTSFPSPFPLLTSPPHLTSPSPLFLSLYSYSRSSTTSPTWPWSSWSVCSATTSSVR